MKASRGSALLSHDHRPTIGPSVNLHCVYVHKSFFFYSVSNNDIALKALCGFVFCWRMQQNTVVLSHTWKGIMGESMKSVSHSFYLQICLRSALALDRRMNVKLSSIKTKKGAGIKEAGCLNLYKPSVCVRKGVRTSETYALLKCRPVDMWWVGSRAESESLSPSCPPGLKTNPMIGTSSTCRLGKEKIIIIIKKKCKTHTEYLYYLCSCSI